MRIDTLGGLIFFRWGLKAPFIKIANLSLKQKKMILTPNISFVEAKRFLYNL